MELSEEEWSVRNELRRRALEARDSLARESRIELGEIICRQLDEELRRIGASFIHCYISFRSEVPTRTFIEQSIAGGYRVVVPVVESLDGREFLVHTEITGLTELRQGRFGLEEPIERTPADLTGLGAIIIPLAAFDRSGSRLGYGKGFYDSFLAHVPDRVPRIGLAFSVQEMAEIPVRERDQPLSAVITELGIIHIDQYRKDL